MMFFMLAIEHINLGHELQS